MEKLSSILVAVDDPESGIALLDKAFLLADRSGARIELSTPDGSCASDFAARCAARGLASRLRHAVRSAEESATIAILRRVQEQSFDLVMKSRPARHALRRFPAASDDAMLVDELASPLLLAGPHLWGREPRFAAALDVSHREGESLSRHILQTAGRLAMNCEAQLDVLYSERELEDDRLRMERAVRLARMVREFHVGCERLEVLKGDPAASLPPIIGARRYDLLALGAVTHRTGLFAGLNSLTAELVQATTGDVLLVDAGDRQSARCTAHGAKSPGREAAPAHP